ncbi:hypothetical protein B0O99DRAFT_558800 [Bisporella sp. PMI_857]|nr:hypothetical protein B0O99DRAFT_558800 [Bisporella sp. PMI_857]
MMATRASFTLQTPSTIKCVHILGSWDLYRRQLPLTKIKQVEDTYEWNNTFEFQVTTLQPGKRYWYYYLLNGYQVSYDSTRAIAIEPTTGRPLNIFDVPSDEPTSNISPGNKHFEIAKGRPLDSSQIRAPIPIPSGLSRVHSVLFDKASGAVEDLTWQFSAAALTRNEREVTSTSLVDRSQTAPANSPVNSHHKLTLFTAHPASV